MMKNISVLGALALAFAALPAHAEFDVKRCMQKCTKYEKEKANNKEKEDQVEKEESKGKNEKKSSQEIRRTCEDICQGDK